MRTRSQIKMDRWKNYLLTLNLVGVMVLMWNLFILHGVLILRESSDVENQPDSKLLFIEVAPDCDSKLLPTLLSFSNDFSVKDTEAILAQWVLKENKNHSAPMTRLLTKLLQEPTPPVPIYPINTSLAHYEYLISTFPKAKFILMVCDPRTIYSKKNTQKTPAYPDTRIEFKGWFSKWNTVVTRSLKECNKTTGKNCIYLNQESLLLAPKATLKTLFDFIEMDFNQYWNTCQQQPLCRNITSCNKIDLLRNMSLWLNVISKSDQKLLLQYAPVLGSLGYRVSEVLGNDTMKAHFLAGDKSLN